MAEPKKTSRVHINLTGRTTPPTPTPTPATPPKSRVRINLTGKKP